MLLESGCCLSSGLSPCLVVRQLESFNQSQTSTIEGALDFYLEVQRFEIALIKQALRVAEGHQRKAAALLNLNSTTLNAMIKRYRIKLELLPDST